ncbi:MAG: hypothetical protein ACKN9E_03940, partial [Microcystaceae cyanobacterium]
LVERLLCKQDVSGSSPLTSIEICLSLLYINELLVSVNKLVSLTLRWVFQSFLFIRWLEIDGIKTIVNLTSNHKYILSFLGSSCQKYCFIS